MNFRKTRDVHNLKKINSFNVWDYSNDYCEKNYKILYKQRCSIIYNLKENKFAKLPFTNFSVYEISEDLGSIFLFKLGGYLSKKEETTLYCFDLDTGSLIKEYNLISHFEKMKKTTICQVKLINKKIYILIEDYELRRYSMISLDIKSNKSENIALGEDLIIDQYHKNMLFAYDDELYIPYLKKKKQLWKPRNMWKINEKGLIKYTTGKIIKYQFLDNKKSYDFFNDSNNIYLACVLNENKKYVIYIYKYGECIVKKV